MEHEQKTQENLYRFPYHYLPRYGNNNFSQMRNLRWGYIYQSYLLHLLDILSNLSFSSLLDVGCGDGRLISELTKRSDFKTKHIEGLDYSNRALAFARAFNPAIRFHEGDITKPGTLTQTYDVITLIETLEHIPPKEIPDFLQAIADHLNERGKFILTVPSDNDPLQEMHYQHFNETSLTKLLTPYFVITKIEHINKQGILNRIISVLLSNRVFVLQQQKLTDLIFHTYRKYGFHARRTNAKRILAICTKR